MPVRLPAWATPNDEDRAKQDELARAANLRVRLSPEERLISVGRQREETARANLKALEKAGDIEGREQTEYVLKAQLAEGLYAQGELKDAIKEHPDEARKAEMLEVAAAISKRDSATCDCDAEPLETEEVYSLKHKRLVTVRKCSNPDCAFANAY